MRIMAFGAHPDDMELCCAGTLAKYKAAGAQVAMVVVTNGQVGSATLPKDQIAALRQREARNSAAVIGAEFFWLGYPDEFLFNTPEVRLNMIDTIRRFGPDIILAPDKDVDYHPDHTTTGQLIWDTHVMVTVPNIETPYGLRLGRSPKSISWTPRPASISCPSCTSTSPSISTPKSPCSIATKVRTPG